MTGGNTATHGSPEGEEPDWLAKFREDLRESDARGPVEITRERRKRFTGPLGVNDDGSPQRELTEAERQHNEDIRTGRVLPGGPIDHLRDLSGPTRLRPGTRRRPG